jgi:3-oxoadipate enol-lactonase
MAPKLLGETTRREQPDLEEAVRRLVPVNSAEGIATALGALRDRPDRTPLLASIAVPTLVLHGDEDAVIPVADAEFTHRGITGSSLVVLPRVGHLGNLEAPVAWNRELAAFLARIA